jgi:aldose 1-epimerase
MSLPLSPKERIHLSAGAYTASLAPAAGGRLASLSFTADGLSHDLIVPLSEDEFDEHHWPKAGGFVMAPFANRLHRGELNTQPHSVKLQTAPGTDHAIHGVSHRRAWTLIQSDRSSAVLSHAHNQPDAEWPWAFSVTQTYRLSHRGLSLRIEIRNTGQETMPVGLGWHPYHPLTSVQTTALFSAVECLTLDSRGAVHSDRLRHAHSAQRSPWPVMPGETVALEGWDGAAKLSISSGAVAEILATDCNNAVIHRPTEGGYICVEPVLCLPGTMGQFGAEIEFLPPGGTRSLEWQCGAMVA